MNIPTGETNLHGILIFRNQVQTRVLVKDLLMENLLPLSLDLTVQLGKKNLIALRQVILKT
jgi:hypothetical protein